MMPSAVRSSWLTVSTEWVALISSEAAVDTVDLNVLGLEVSAEPAAIDIDFPFEPDFLGFFGDRLAALRLEHPSIGL